MRLRRSSSATLRHSASARCALVSAASMRDAVVALKVLRAFPFAGLTDWIAIAVLNSVLDAPRLRLWGLISEWADADSGVDDDCALARFQHLHRIEVQLAQLGNNLDQRGDARDHCHQRVTITTRHAAVSSEQAAGAQLADHLGRIHVGDGSEMK